MTAIVTGAGRGIGRAIALQLSTMGARVFLSARGVKALEGVAHEIAELGGQASPAPMDIRNTDEIQRVIQGIIKEAGQIDILVNNAGINRDKLLVRTKQEDWQAVVETNLYGTFCCMQQVLPAMSKRRYGRIVNITSVVAFSGNPGQANYAAAKAGIMGMTKSAAREYATRGITINAVAPGLIETAMTESLHGEVKEQLLTAIPMKRLGTPEETAYAVACLVTAEASYITGQVIHVNGGMYM